jgi:O-antigen ligase
VLVSAAIAVVVLFANLALPHRVRLVGVAVLLVPQLYLPGLPASLAVLWTLLTCVAGLIGRGRSRADSPLVVISGLIVAATAVSLLWALPSGIRPGVVTVIFGVVFLLWLREVIVLARDDPGLLDTIVLWTIPGVALQSVLSIVFRLSPTIEGKFLRSQLAGVTVGRAASHLYTDLPNNVLETGKSGGFFVNGNVASLFGAVAALLLCVAARRTMHRWLYLFAGLSLAGAVFTGSKSVLVIGTSLAIVILVLPRVLRGSAVLVALSIALLLPLTFSSLTGFLERVAPTFYANVRDSYGTREDLWTRAGRMFQESPVLGPGFGGWLEKVGRVGSRADLPPHNVFVATWAYSGIVALAVVVVFMVATLVFGFRVAAAQPTLRDRRTAVLALCAIAWAFLHGMGDNTGLYGDRQSMILVAVAFGYLYAMARDRKQVSLGFTSDETQDPTAISVKAPGDQQSPHYRGHPRLWADERPHP